MHHIISVEKLSEYAIKQIESIPETCFSFVDRDIFFQSPQYCEKAEILICRDRDRLSDIIDSCSLLKLIFIVSVGVENLPFDVLSKKNIIVCNPKGINAPIMSEYTFGAILAQSTRILENYQNQKIHKWKRFQCIAPLRDKTLLIVGAGSAGKLIAQKAKVFGMNVIGIKNHILPMTHFDHIYSIDKLDDLLTLADYVVCTIPLTKSTYHLFDRKRLQKMKKSALFINISRGDLVVEEDLRQALINNEIAGAVLDVFNEEPLDCDSLLWDTPNLFVSPHSAGRLENFVDKTIPYFLESYCAYIKGQTIPNRVELENGY